MNRLNARNRTSLYLAAEYAKNNAAKADIDDTRDGENIEALTVLLEAGADVNASDDEGLTPIMVAARRGHVNAVKLLSITWKASLDKVDKNDCNIIHLCAREGKHEIIQVPRILLTSI